MAQKRAENSAPLLDYILTDFLSYREFNLIKHRLFTACKPWFSCISLSWTKN